MDWIDISTDLKQILTAEQAWHYSIIPKSNGSSLSFYIDKKKYSSQLQDELELLFGLNVKLHKKHSELINNSLSRHYHRNVNHSSGITKGLSLNSANGDFLTQIIEDAYKINASDIHIEAYKDSARVRFRIDGKLLEKFTIDQQSYPSLINKIKIKAKLDIAEKRLPQDGRIFYDLGEHSFDIRVSSLPSLHGEKLVLRLLNKSAAHIDIQDLGFEDKQLNDYLTGLKKTHGIVLISGPTGSGKTTTLYSFIEKIKSPETKFITLEDPVEYKIEGISQMQVNSDIGFTFAAGLRSILRQDPDVIMVGEIRDSETAQIALQSSMTGHLVFSTVHTNDAPSAYSRLTDLGVEEFLLNEAILGVIAQRLVRKLCSHCKTEHPDSAQLLQGEDFAFLAGNNQLEPKVYQPVGCAHCNNSGFAGRSVISEYLPNSNHIKQIKKDDQFSIQARQYMESQKLRSLKQDVYLKVAKGITSMEEAIRVVGL